MYKVVVVIPNWNGESSLRGCIDSVLSQSLKPHLIMVDNGSVDGSVDLVEKYYPEVEIIKHDHNKGYAGGVNPGFRRAIEMKADYAAPFNNDAIADKLWLETLVNYLDSHEDYGMAAPVVLAPNGTVDTTGEIYTIWGVVYPRGRGKADASAYQHQTEIFAAGGAASLYRVSMLKQTGLLDEDFFAYYEDVDLGFRAQLRGWKAAYVPDAIVHHDAGTTSGRIKGFTTYQALKNLPLIIIKDVPGRLLVKIVPRFFLLYCAFFGLSLLRGHFLSACKGFLGMVRLLPRKIGERRIIQKQRKVSSAHIDSILVHGLPPDIRTIRALRQKSTKRSGHSE